MQVSDRQLIKLRRIRSRGNLTEKVYQRLKDAITRGHIAPGVLLQEHQVTKALSISRTPLREAFNRLAMEGLIETMPNKGVRVVELGKLDVYELFETREPIETHFLWRSMQNLGPEDYARMREKLSSAEQSMLEAKTPEEIDKAQVAYLTADRGMHDELVMASGNQVWIKIYFNIRERIQIVGHRIGRIPGELLSTVKQHYHILDALEDGDLEQAKARILSHIRESREMALDALEEMNQKPQAAQG
jgi:DNA-binding GntR family transcriptional regulator